MCSGVAVACNRVQMICGRIAFVSIEAVPRVAPMQLEHLPVARHLRHDRCRGNRGAPAVAVQDSSLRHGQIGDPKRIHEHDIGKRREREDGALHGPQRRLVNVDAVDLERVGLSRGPRHRVANDLFVQDFPLRCGYRLRVGNSGYVPIGVQHDSSRHHSRNVASVSSMSSSVCEE